MGEAQQEAIVVPEFQRFEESEVFAELRAIRKPTFVDEVLESENALQAGKKTAEELWVNKISKADLPKLSYKNPLDTMDLPTLDAEFEKEIKKRPAVKKELDRIDKKMKTSLHLYNAQLEIAAYTKFLEGDIPSEERKRVNALLTEAQKVAFLLNKKLLEDLTKDKRDLARFAGGLTKTKEMSTVMATTEEDKKELKEKKEDATKADIHRLAVSSSFGGRGSISISAGNRNANYYGGQARGGYSFRARGSGRGTNDRGRGGGRASQSTPSGRQ